MTDALTNAGSISGLYLYPIKGCRGVAVESITIEPGGPRGDRRYMVVNEDGVFVSQRNHPLLATVSCIPTPVGSMRIEAEGQPSVAVPQPTATAPLALARIWRDEVRVQVSEAGSAWFSELLQAEVRLVYLPQSELRQANPGRSRPGDLVGLADGYPLLWTNQASLDDLNGRLAEPIGMDRFRPNLVTKDLPAYTEDTAHLIQAGPGEFTVPKLCDRCLVTTTHQLSGERGREPLRTLAAYRKWHQAVWFGANLLPDRIQASAGFTLRVGDPLRVVAARAHPALASQPED